MTVQLLFGTSVAFGFIAWAVVANLYIWSQLRTRSRIDALRPLLVLHAFRFIGLSFLVPGVVSPDLPIAFARDAAYGDIVAAILALAALATLRSGVGIALAWAFNLWGSFDLLNAFYQANAAGLLPGQLGTAYFDLRAQIDEIVAQAKAEGSLPIALKGLNSIRQTLDSLSRLSGFDRQGTQVNVAVQTNVNIELTALAERIIQKFDREPELKARIAQALVEVDDEQAA